jgi:hypothetical protein
VSPVRRLLGLAVVCALVAPAGATASPVAVRAAPTAAAAPAPALGAFRSRGFGGGLRTRNSRRYPYGYGYGRSRARRHGGSFFRGVFVGWLLSHLFRGGVPLFPIFVLAFLLLAVRRRRLRGPGMRLR